MNINLIKHYLIKLAAWLVAILFISFGVIGIWDEFPKITSGENKESYIEYFSLSILFGLGILSLRYPKKTEWLIEKCIDFIYIPIFIAGVWLMGKTLAIVLWLIELLEGVSSFISRLMKRIK